MLLLFDCLISCWKRFYHRRKPNISHIDKCAIKMLLALTWSICPRFQRFKGGVCMCAVTAVIQKQYNTEIVVRFFCVCVCGKLALIVSVCVCVCVSAKYINCLWQGYLCFVQMRFFFAIDFAFFLYLSHYFYLWFVISGLFR